MEQDVSDDGGLVDARNDLQLTSPARTAHDVGRKHPLEQQGPIGDE